MVKFNEIHKLIAFCVGEEGLFTHQLGSDSGFSQKASDLLCKQFSFLPELGSEVNKWLDEVFLILPSEERTYDKIEEKLSEYEKRFGKTFEVKQK